MPDPQIFHDHLDACRRCRENPMDLCPVGSVKLREAALGPEASIPGEDTRGRRDARTEEEARP